MTKIVIAATAIYGHVAPMLSIATDLIARGDDVTFMTGSSFREAVEKTGATFEPVSGLADVDPALFASPERLALEGLDQLNWDLQHFVVGAVGDQWKSLQRVLALPGNDRAVVLSESGFWGVAPGLAGAPGIIPRGYAVVGVVPLTLTSLDLAPFGSGQAPATSDAERTAYEDANSFAQNILFRDTQILFVSLLRDAGVTGDIPFFFDAVAVLAQKYMQLSVEELSYVRSDLPATISFIGALPTPTVEDPELPSWWDDVVTADQVVVVSQGTISNMDFSELIQPTLDALADLPVLVVATTSSTVSVERVPANARVAQFIPFVELLPHTSVLVSNGGYGGVQQALSFGVPMVLAGATEDKIEGNARTAYTGAAINLQTQRPTSDQIRAAVKSVLAEQSYRAKAQDLQAQYAAVDPYQSIADAVTSIAYAVAI
jgi:UDP:flavonoid glycosyltransferase YjiC (YdhE family)